jgi:hypothetical protein
MSLRPTLRTFGASVALGRWPGTFVGPHAGAHSDAAVQRKAFTAGILPRMGPSALAPK